MSGNQKQQQAKQTQTKASAPKAPAQPEQSVNLEQLVAAPETMRSEELIAAQKQVGNQMVQRALDGNKKRDAMTDEQGFLKGEINDAIQKKRGGGSPLPDSLREDAGKRLGHDFDNVRIHTDEQANELSQSINARAFTIGKDIFFKKGVFSPGSRAGRETLMHELTHVVQQSGGSGASGRLKLGGTDTAHEKQADKVGKANSGITAASSAAVQREEMPEDELMMQEEEELQMQEEEELQMQPDTGVQREEMPEDELQMQPDAGVVQRDLMDEMREKQRSMNLGSEEHVKKIDQVGAKKSEAKPEQSDMMKEFMAKREKMMGSKNQKKSFEKLEGDRKKAFDTTVGVQYEKSEKDRLIEQIKDPNSSKEDVDSAKEKLKDLHGSKKKDIKGLISERSGALKTSAQKGDAEAYDKWKSEKVPTKKEKFAGGAKKVGGFLGGLGKRFLGKAADDMSEQLFGKKEEEKKEEAKPAPMQVNVAGGGGDSGGFAMLEKYITENQKLKAENEELKAKVAN